VVVGDANGAPPVEYRALIGIAGIAFGQTAWFTGSDVAALIAVGYLEAL